MAVPYVNTARVDVAAGIPGNALPRTVTPSGRRGPGAR